MKLFKLFLIGILVAFSSCTEEQADIKRLYNSKETFKIDFSSWESFDQAILKSPGKQFPGVSFMYSKKNDCAYLVFDDASHGEYSGVRYNKLKSDDSQTCLQNDKVRFVILNNGTRYALKMFYWQNLEWNELAYFDDGKSVSVDSVKTGASFGVAPIFVIVTVILIAVMIWGIRKKKIAAIITPCLMLAILSATVTFGFVDGSGSTGNGTSEDRMPIDSLCTCSDNGFTEVYELPGGNSSVIGKIYDNDNKSYPVFSSDGPWYEIEYNGVTGYVYERDCILQSGMGDI